MKKLFVIFLCILAVFAIVSCKSEPKQENEPEPVAKPQITDEEHAAVLAGTACYRLTATRGAKRFALVYTEDEGFCPEEGTVLTLKYRTSEGTDVERLYIRDASEGKYLGEGIKYHDILAEDDPYVSVPDADGWISFSFTFPAMVNPESGDALFSGIRLEFANGGFAEDEYLEIRDLALGDKKLTIEGPADKETAEEYQSECGVWNFGNGNGDHTWPILSVKPL